MYENGQWVVSHEFDGASECAPILIPGQVVQLDGTLRNMPVRREELWPLKQFVHAQQQVGSRLNMDFNAPATHSDKLPAPEFP
jgi:hypothetical protein